jgi:hypothetical protein
MVFNLGKFVDDGVVDRLEVWVLAALPSYRIDRHQAFSKLANFPLH